MTNIMAEVLQQDRGLRRRRCQLEKITGRLDVHGTTWGHQGQGTTVLLESALTLRDYAVYKLAISRWKERGKAVRDHVSL